MMGFGPLRHILTPTMTIEVMRSISILGGIEIESFFPLRVMVISRGLLVLRHKLFCAVHTAI